MIKIIREAETTPAEEALPEATTMRLRTQPFNEAESLTH